jgi:hypothetical protein
LNAPSFQHLNSARVPLRGGGQCMRGALLHAAMRCRTCCCRLWGVALIAAAIGTLLGASPPSLPAVSSALTHARYVQTWCTDPTNAA